MIMNKDFYKSKILEILDDKSFYRQTKQRTSGPVNAHMISRATVSTKTSFAKFDIVLIRVKVNSGSLFI